MVPDCPRPERVAGQPAVAGLAPLLPSQASYGWCSLLLTRIRGQICEDLVDSRELTTDDDSRAKREQDSLHTKGGAVVTAGRCLPGVVLVIAGLAAIPLLAGADPLAEHRWVHRLLVLYVPDSSSGRRALEGFIAAVARDIEAVRERDVMIAVVGDLPRQPGASPVSLRLSADDAREVQERLRLDGHAPILVLVGKDGGVKVRQVGALDLQRIFEAIDLMPMRQAEIKSRP